MAIHQKCADVFCGIVKALDAVALGQATSVGECLWPRELHDRVDALAGMLTNLWPERFGATYVRKRVTALALEAAAMPIGQATQKIFSEFYRGLETFEQRNLCICPIEGIELVDDEPVVFGPFQVQRATQPATERIDVLIAQMLTHTQHTADEQRDIASRLQEDYRSSVSGRAVVQAEIIADPEQAHSVFVTKAKVLMDILQMCSEIIEFCGQPRVRLGGYSHAGVYSAWVLPITGRGFFQPNQRVGSIGAITLSRSNVATIRRAGVMRLADALVGKATDLEAALFRAVHWFAHAISEEQVGLSTVSSVICLEAVMGSSSARSVAEDVALLVGKNVWERQRLYTLVREAYSVRNVVVHEGDVAHTFSRERDFRTLVRQFITCCIWLCDEVQSPTALRRRVAHLRFS